jgi:general stress protein 26
MATTTDDPITRLRELTTEQRTVMLTTQSRSGATGTAGLDARPLTVLDTDDQGSIWFLVSRSSDWVAALAADTPAVVTGADDDDGSWFSVSGSVFIVDDRARITELWNPAAGAWFEGADDPDLVALRVQAAELSWWDSPSSGLVRLFKIAKAALGGDADDVGDHATESITPS